MRVVSIGSKLVGKTQTQLTNLYLDRIQREQHSLCTFTQIGTIVYQEPLRISIRGLLF